MKVFSNKDLFSTVGFCCYSILPKNKIKKAISGHLAGDLGYYYVLITFKINNNSKK